MKGPQSQGSDPPAERAGSPLAVSPRRTRRRLLAFALLVAAPILLFLGGFALFAHHVGSLTTPAEPRAADAIIVLTGGSARVDTGVELLQAGKGSRLLISGVNPMAGIEDIRRATGGDRDLFECCVDIDHAAMDTVGNAEESAKWVMRHAFASVILVTNNYHMPRSLMEMRRFLGDLDVQPYPVVHSRLDRGVWISRPGALRVLFTEYAKFVGSFARGLVDSGPDRPHVATLADTAPR